MNCNGTIPSLALLHVYNCSVLQVRIEISIPLGKGMESFDSLLFLKLGRELNPLPSYPTIYKQEDELKERAVVIGSLYVCIRTKLKS